MKWPWPRRTERRKDLSEARAQAEQSGREARKARRLADDLRSIAGDDVARAIMEGLVPGDKS